MMIPGIVITVATFPGYVMQTVSRKLVCDLLGIPVYEAQYFVGKLTYAKQTSTIRAVAVTFAPFVVNTLLCGILLFPIGFGWLLDSKGIEDSSAIPLILLWSGVSVGMHALPGRRSIIDAISHIPDGNRHGFFYALLVVLSNLFFIVDILKRFWLDLFYAIGVGVLSPLIVTKVAMYL